MSKPKISSFCDRVGCVEVEIARFGKFASVWVRDSKDPDAELNFTTQEWNDFLAGVKAGEFDLDKL